MHLKNKNLDSTVYITPLTYTAKLFQSIKFKFENIAEKKLNILKIF